MAKQKIVTVYGLSKATMETGKAYQVSKEQGDKLVKKGLATYQKPKAKEV
jgi:hypothetical protein